MQEESFLDKTPKGLEKNHKEEQQEQKIEEQQEKEERKPLGDITMEEKKRWIERIEEAKKITQDQTPRENRNKLLKLRDEILRRYKFPKYLNVYDFSAKDWVDNTTFFEIFDKYAGSNLNDIQVEGIEQAKKIEEVEKSAERIRYNLNGLKHEPISSNEVEAVSSAGIIFKDGEGEILLDVEAVKQYSIDRLSSETGISAERIEQLVNREESLNYLLNYCQVFDRKKLFYSKYFTIAELVERKEEFIVYLKKAKEEIKNYSEPQQSLQLLADKYRLQMDEIFYIDEETGKVIVKPLNQKGSEEAQLEFDQTIEHFTSYKDRFQQVIERSRTGINIGVLIVAEDKKSLSYEFSGGIGGSYYNSLDWRLSGDFKKTGLIVLPPVIIPDVLEHEYAHFEYHIFDYTGKSKEECCFIDEINSFFIGVPKEELNQNLNFFKTMKEIFQYYINEKPETMLLSSEEAKNKIDRLIDVIEYMYKNGLSKEVISSILMAAKTFQDVLQWEDIDEQKIREMSSAEKIQESCRL